MLTHSMTATLIKTRLKLVYGEQIEELGGAIWQLATSKNGQIIMEKGWETLQLHMNLNTNSGNRIEKHDQNGSKQTPFAIASSTVATSNYCYLPFIFRFATILPHISCC
jgi:hypothetical protein